MCHTQAMMAPEYLIAPFDNLVAPDLQEALLSWVKNRLFEKRISDHTVKNYLHDLRSFFEFQKQHHSASLKLKDLSVLELRDFRSFLAHRLSKGVSHRSNARATSALRTFFKYLKKNYNLDNKILPVESPRNQ